MRLTEAEKAMLAGQSGPAVQMAMEIIVQLGDLYGAEELLPISQAHIDGGLYTAVGEAGLLFAEKLADLGGRVRVPTSMNATSRDIANWRDHRVGAAFDQKNIRMEQAYVRMGVVPTWTCAPYQAGLVPRFGEQIAWAESNAIVYANSVIGARTERYGDYTDICCAITGRAPLFGLHLTENRRGQILLDCSGLALRDEAADFAVLGYLTGELAQDKIPVLSGIPAWITPDQLKAFAAAIASSGAVALFHMVGITPEAASLEAAFQGTSPARTVAVTPAMFRDAASRLSRGDQGQVDAVLIGCPHASAPEVMAIAQRLAGKKVAPGMELWIYTSQAPYRCLEQTDALEILRQAGARVIRDTCFINTDLSGWKFRAVMTNSAKYAHYMPSRTGLGVVFADLDQCLATALTGKMPAAAGEGEVE